MITATTPSPMPSPTLTPNAASPVAAPPLSLAVDGMTCASCAGRVEKALARLPGVESAQVNLASETAQVRWQPGARPDAQAAADAVRRAGYGVREQALRLQVQGMSCAACVTRVEKALLRVPGVAGAKVNLASETAAVRLLGGQAVQDAALAALAKAGYPAQPVDDGAAGHPPPAEARWSLAVAAALSAPLLLPMLLLPLGVHLMIPGALQCLLATPVQFGFGARFYRAGCPALGRPGGRGRFPGRLRLPPPARYRCRACLASPSLWSLKTWPHFVAFATGQHWIETSIYQCVSNGNPLAGERATLGRCP